MKSVLIKIALCFCVVQITFAADPMPDALRDHQCVVSKLEAARLEKLAQRVFSLEKTAQLQDICDKTYKSGPWIINNPKITKLLQEGAYPDVRDDSGGTLLSHASCKRDLPIMHSLLQAGANPNSQDYFYMTPIFFVKDLKSAQLLVEYGANLKHIDVFGDNLLHVAQSSSLVEFYRHAGIDPNKKGVSGYTPLQNFCVLAKKCGQKNTEMSLKILLLAGGDLSIEDGGWDTPLEILRRNCSALVAPIRAFNEKLPVLKAIKKEKLRILKSMMDECCLRTKDLSQLVVDYYDPEILLEDIEERVDAVGKNAMGCIIS